MHGADGKQALTVSVPGGPTGTVFNGSATDFVVSQAGKSGAARFLFATEAGTILGWSPTVNANTAIPGVDRSSTGAVYKGLTTMSDRLYATDFHNGHVDVFDASLNPITTAAFKDPKLPAGYAPFGIQALNGSIFVTYAKQDAAKSDVAGNGFGYVDQFTPDGVFARASRPRTQERSRRTPRSLRSRRQTSVSFRRCPVGNWQRPDQRVQGFLRGLLRASSTRRPDADRRSTGFWPSPRGNGAGG